MRPSMPVLVYWTVLLVLGVWFDTFTTAVVNGDDVVHMSLKGSFVTDSFLFHTYSSWIPNRVLDMYGRSLLVGVFDLIYFPLREITGVDFFTAYKIFSATLFSFFHFFLFVYLTNRLFLNKSLYREDHWKKDPYHYLVVILMSLIVVTTLEWRNAVHFIAYQLPGVLIFVFLNELRLYVSVCNQSSLGQDGSDHESPGGSTKSRGIVSATTLAILSFVSSFSLEAFSLIIFLYSISLIFFFFYKKSSFFNTGNQSINFVRIKAFYLYILTAAFSLTAIVIARLYSGRVLVTEQSFEKHTLGIKDIALEFYKDSMLFGVFYSRSGFVLFSLLIFMLVLGRVSMFFVKNESRLTPLTVTLKESSKKKSAYLYYLYFLLVSTISVLFISYKSNQNYFSYTIYPWGGLLIPIKIASAYYLAYFLIDFQADSRFARTSVGLFMFVFISNLTLSILKPTNEKYEYSKKIQVGYAYALQKNKLLEQDEIYNTGLNLASIPMPEKPLPDATAPQWFKDDYKKLFNKYYDTELVILFE